MRKTGKKWYSVLFLMLIMCCMLFTSVSAQEASGDNSLYSLGLENATCEPEFYYSTLEYTVTVPGGTEELALAPVTSDPNATIIDLSGTKLENGSGTVLITVEAPNGAQVTYTLHVIADVTTPQTEAAPAEKEKTKEEKKAEKAKKKAESEETARLAADLQASQGKVDTLTAENADLKDRIDLLLKVMYGLIGFAVLLLFFIINQSLRNKDLKDDLKDARVQADQSYDFARKEQNLQSDFYYTPVNAQPQMMQHPSQGMPMEEATRNVQAAFGNASQVLQAQPFPGQANAPVMTAQTETPVQEKEKKLSRKEMKKLEKESKKAAPVVQEEPTMVHSTMEEPDINVDMIDL